MPTTPTIDADLLTLREVAEIMRIGRTTAWRLTNRGDLPSIRVAPREHRGMIRVSRDDLVAYLADVNRDQAEMRRVEVAR